MQTYVEHTWGAPPCPDFWAGRRSGGNVNVGQGLVKIVNTLMDLNLEPWQPTKVGVR